MTVSKKKTEGLTLTGTQPKKHVDNHLLDSLSSREALFVTAI